MTKDELINEYFNWIYRLVCDGKHIGRLSYRKLLACLHGIDFTYTVDMDGNREADGADLRYRFGYEQKYPDPLIAAYLDDRPCSVLEMMVALAIRCEEHIMGDADIGDRTGQWFWDMLVNLGLNGMNDKKFDREYTESVISRFLNREYGKDGKGGLFTIENCKHDLRDVEIWYQMCWHLAESE